MTIRYNVTGARRKELVKVISDTIEVKPKYLGMPTAAYKIDYFTVTKDGTLEFDDRADSEEIEELLEAIANAGFECEAQEADTEEVSNEPQTSEHSENVGLTIAVPLDSLEIENFRKLLLGKESLIKKAFNLDELPVNIDGDKAIFPWFDTAPEADALKAYTDFITALAKMSKTAKRVSVKDKPVDNEKYAFRCFLLRLGFIGDEYKASRKILLRNFEGSSAFKTVKEAE